MLPLLGPGSIGSGPSAADAAEPTAVRVTGFPGIAPSTVDRLTSATIGFDFSNGVTGGSDSAQLIIETNATRFTSGFVSAFNTGNATITGFAPAAPEPAIAGYRASRGTRGRQVSVMD